MIRDDPWPDRTPPTQLSTEVTPCDERTAPAMRRWTADTLTRALPEDESRGTVIEDAQLVVSELVTNGVRAGCRQLEVRLLLRPAEIVIEVDEDAPGRPRPVAHRPTDDHGRGLALVAALSREWGVTENRAGKTVWAVLPAAAISDLPGATCPGPN